MINGEKVFVSLYSNDIDLDSDYCNYYFTNIERIDNLLTKKQIDNLNKSCDLITRKNSISKKNYQKIIFIHLIGEYNYYLFREMALRFLVNMRNNFNVGRLKYVNFWSDFESTNNILALEVINSINKVCEKYECDVSFASFPNVENLSEDSIIRNSHIKFSNHLQNKYDIKIRDGYIPFLDQQISNSTFSLTDFHSSCEGYKIYSEWLIK